MQSFSNFYDNTKLESLYSEYKSFDSMSLDDLAVKLTELELIDNYINIIVDQLRTYASEMDRESIFHSERLTKIRKALEIIDRTPDENVRELMVEFNIETRVRNTLLQKYKRYFSKVFAKIFRKFPLQALLEEEGDIINMLSYFREGKNDISLSHAQKMYNAVCYLNKYIRDEDRHYNIPNRMNVNIHHMKPTSKALEIYKITTDSPAIRIQKILSEAILKHIKISSEFTLPFMVGIGLDKFTEAESDINDYVVGKFAEYILNIFPLISNSQLFNIAYKIVDIPIEERVERVEFIIEYIERCRKIEGTHIKDLINKYQEYNQQESELIENSNIRVPVIQSLGPSNHTNMRGDVSEINKDNARQSIAFALQCDINMGNIANDFTEFVAMKRRQNNDTFNRVSSAFKFENSTFISDIIPIFDINMKMLKHYLKTRPYILEKSWFLKLSNVMVALSDGFTYGIIDCIDDCIQSTSDKNTISNFTKTIGCLISRRELSISQYLKPNVFSKSQTTEFINSSTLQELSIPFIRILFNISQCVSFDSNELNRFIECRKIVTEDYINDIVLIYSLCSKNKLLSDYNHSFCGLLNEWRNNNLNLFTRIAKMLTFKYLFSDEEYETAVISRDHNIPILTYIDIDSLNIRANLKKYKETIDVHDDDRDERTERIVTIMFESQNLSDEDANKEFLEFWDYATMLSEHSRKLFDRFMGFDKDMEEITSEIKGINDYAGFLTEDTRIEGKKYDPKYVIGNFWRFCKEYPRDNLKELLFTGIMKSHQLGEDGVWYVVCNGGKLQNLAMSTLQGRILDDNDQIYYIDDITLFDKIKDVKIEEKSPATIYNIMRPFIKGISEGSIPKNANEFYRQLFEFINKYKPDITCEEAVRIITLYAEKDGFGVYPSLSLASAFEDCIDTDEYIQMTEQVKVLAEEANDDNVYDDNLEYFGFDDFDNNAPVTDQDNQDNDVNINEYDETKDDTELNAGFELQRIIFQQFENRNNEENEENRENTGNTENTGNDEDDEDNINTGNVVRIERVEQTEYQVPTTNDTQMVTSEIVITNQSEEYFASLYPSVMSTGYGELLETPIIFEQIENGVPVKYHYDGARLTVVDDNNDQYRSNDNLPLIPNLNGSLAEHAIGRMFRGDCVFLKTYVPMERPDNTHMLQQSLLRRGLNFHHTVNDNENFEDSIYSYGNGKIGDALGEYDEEKTNSVVPRYNEKQKNFIFSYSSSSSHYNSIVLDMFHSGYIGPFTEKEMIMIYRYWYSVIPPMLDFNTCPRINDMDVSEVHRKMNNMEHFDYEDYYYRGGFVSKPKYTPHETVFVNDFNSLYDDAIYSRDSIIMTQPKFVRVIECDERVRCIENIRSVRDIKNVEDIEDIEEHDPNDYLEFGTKLPQDNSSEKSFGDSIN